VHSFVSIFHAGLRNGGCICDVNFPVGVENLLLDEPVSKVRVKCHVLYDPPNHLSTRAKGIDPQPVAVNHMYKSCKVAVGPADSKYWDCNSDHTQEIKTSQ
jgi:hypothetical protein